ncbi:MAG: hypothetical protein HY904_15300 [Deltaproteobacteria bacterium]|nr:hypothetical protein [Deltaproteobacteria bacterium]
MVALTSPAHDGTTFTAPIALNSTVTFVATITDNAAINSAGVSWTVTPPGGSPSTPSGGALAGNQASYQALLNVAGAWTIRVSYSDGFNAPVSAQAVAQVHADLPPQLAWISPANDGARVTGARRVGSQLLFQASLSDDAALLPQNATWSHRDPGGTTATSQGVFVGTGANAARMEYTADLATPGTHTITATYSDGTTTRAISLEAVVLADLPATAAFTAPAHDGTSVTVPVAVGDNLTFSVSLSDDTGIIPQNGQFNVTSPSGTQSNQGTVNVNGNSATATLAVAFASAGSWRVSFTYTDAGGNTTTVTLTITVAQDPAPAVAITAPTNDGAQVTAQVRESTAISFTGSIQDNAAIVPQGILWTYAPVGGQPITSQGTVTGNGNLVAVAFNVANAGAAGSASVSLRYTDSGGNTVTRTLIVPVISNLAPALALTAPANNGARANATVRVGTPVNFAATITDDQAIVSSGIAWLLTSPGGSATPSPGGFNPGNPATTGTATFVASLVAPGDWTVQVGYTDATGLSASVQILVTAVANNPPTCTWTAPAACLGSGNHAFSVTLADPDGDTPVVAAIHSDNAGDVVTTLNVSGSGTRTVNINLAAGTRTLSCTPTDSTGLAGSAGLLAITTSAAPTLSINQPVDGARITLGQPLDYQVSATTSPLASPGTVTLTDSEEGVLALDAGGAGSVAAPILGLHELVSSVVDTCGATATARARYGVTTAGGALTTLGTPVDTGGAIVVTHVAMDGTTPVLGTDNSPTAWALYSVDPATAVAAPLEPAVAGDTILNGTQTPVTSISMGGANGGARFETYSFDGDGLFLCARDMASNQAVCRQFRQGDANLRSDNVVAAAVAGSGLGQGESYVLVLSGDRLQLYAPMAFNGGGGTQVTLQQAGASVQQGSAADQLPGNFQALAVVSLTVGATSSTLVAWVGTSNGAHRVTFTITAGGTTRSIQHFDASHPQNNNAWPSFNVRAIALDPAGNGAAWFGLASGIGRYDGSGFPAGFDAITTTSGGAPTDITSLAVDRFPSATVPILWAGTGGAGFWRIDGTVAGTPLGIQVTTTDGLGLPSNTVNSIAVDAAHTKWIGTPMGAWAYLGY